MGGFSLNCDGIEVGLQDDPWNVLVRANVTMIVKDSAQTATFTTTEFVTAKVSIVGFEDPLYVVNTYGRLTNAINITHYELLKNILCLDKFTISQNRKIYKFAF